ncbi:hypothetical protein BK128_04675 [Viridibacillus sp. FSL H7-0596]|uniref:hypothetical protein n=1 Tax=Viridibacillus sp. FSL H7-0596 TaxID=1928923 RepID=UPI00096EFF01|nr:hypothetical protein [Viridibacillus sp. FSL H7-0596]OMC89221.1 hypothetical protein BK128_04675 [Viridibacillus sp. FSL H7-0596]
MNQIFNPEVYEDELIQQVLELLAQGKKKDEVASICRKQWKTIDMYFRRRQFHWKDNTFVPKEPVIDEAYRTIVGDSRAANITRQLMSKNADIQSVAIKNGFQNEVELGKYMRTKDFVWDKDNRNYKFEPKKSNAINESTITIANTQVDSFIPTSLEEYKELLSFLMYHENQLRILLGNRPNLSDEYGIPNYKIKGNNDRITLTISSTLKILLKDFSDSYNTNQRTVLEAALIEFFQKYGYKNHVNEFLLNGRV